MLDGKDFGGLLDATIMAQTSWERADANVTNVYILSGVFGGLSLLLLITLISLMVSTSRMRSEVRLLIRETPLAGRPVNQQQRGHGQNEYGQPQQQPHLNNPQYHRF